MYHQRWHRITALTGSVRFLSMSATLPPSGGAEE
jgi:hypothetical protein